MSKTACVVPFTTLDISPDGTPIICCQAPVALTVDGRLANAKIDSIEKIWNAPEIVELRGAMARGEKPDACRICWEHENAGSLSLRRIMGESIHYTTGADWSLVKFMRASAAAGHRLETRPRWYQLQFGNTCNLRCRSCWPESSSRIAADPVHRAWYDPDSYRIARGPAAWYRDPERLAEILDGDDEILLSLLGGEPFLIQEVWDFLQMLVDRGWSRRVVLTLTTNGTRQRAELERLAPAFRNFIVSVSIDGHGPLFEYLRSGAKWTELVQNLDWLVRVPHVRTIVSPTMQNTNVLSAVKLFRFFDERALDATFNVLTNPGFLSEKNLPPRVRRIAAERLRAYLDEDCRPENGAVVQAWATLLEQEHELDPKLFHDFMVFTNDLDASRGQSLADVDPELFALLRASGIEWTNERRHAQSSVEKTIASAPARVNATVSADDAIMKLTGSLPLYLQSGSGIVDAIESILHKHGHEGLANARAVADFASHYGRITRVLQARTPHAVVYACDIDSNAVAFCERELGAVPVVTGWRPDEDELPRDVDVVVCISLLTHTPLDHWRRTLRAWQRMLRPGGIVVFTFLSETYFDSWRAGEMEVYGNYSPPQRDEVVHAFEQHGFAACELRGDNYGGDYGIAFARSEIVRAEVANAGLELLELEDNSASFGQSVVAARKPGEQTNDMPEPRVVNRDVRVIALYDSRFYENGERESVWSQLAAAQPPRPLPADLGFCDPRVAEVREAQAALARAHGIDAFCFVQSKWDAPLRDVLAAGRPDFPYCILWRNEDRAAISDEDAEQLFIELLPHFRDPRYVRRDGRPLFIVADVATLPSPRMTAAKWRAIAEAEGVGEMHLCAVEPIPTDLVDDIGFDSLLEAPAMHRAKSYRETAANALTRHAPPKFIRTVVAQREPFDATNVEHYELWLRSILERQTDFVFIDGWNAWSDGAYLEPDDRDGRAFLNATRRATRGLSSGKVLVRRLRDTLGNVNGDTGRLLSELDQVVSMHERSRDELSALIEAALVTSNSNGSSMQRGVLISPRVFEASPGRVSVDAIGTLIGPQIHGTADPVMLDGHHVTFRGWAHSGVADPNVVDLFLVLTSGGEDRVYRVFERTARPDVVSAFPDYPERCGFEGTIPIRELPPGDYRVGIVQRTPSATFYDPTTLSVRRA
ncbi:MAG: hypothetical protein DMF56_09400 [Acidobacteria bacterium]|nr:MAG: hypothetical protein DMF56_09400 [Acidobacteriota bacterium]